MAKCPNCGFRGPHADNGLSPASPDYTLLCENMVDPEDWASAESAEDYPDLWQNGRVPCGMQWGPNE